MFIYLICVRLGQLSIFLLTPSRNRRISRASFLIVFRPRGGLVSAVVGVGDPVALCARSGPTPFRTTKSNNAMPHAVPSLVPLLARGDPLCPGGRRVAACMGGLPPPQVFLCSLSLVYVSNTYRNDTGRALFCCTEMLRLHAGQPPCVRTLEAQRVLVHPCHFWLFGGWV